jgi:hypothetical protein
MPFPFDLKSPIYAFELRGPEGWTVPRISLPALRDAIQDTVLGPGMLPEAPSPDDMRSDYLEKRGWAWLDDQDVVSVNEWLCFAARRYIKKVPAKTLKALVARQQRLIEEGGGKFTREERKVFRENLERELLMRAPPDVSETPVLYDCHAGVFYLFTSSENVRKAMVESVMRILRQVYDENRLWPEEQTLTRFLDYTRPGAVLPGEFDLRFLTWTSQQALHGRFMHDGIERGIGLELLSKLDLEIDSDKLKVTGHKSVERFVLTETEREDGVGKVTSVEMRIHVAPDATYEVTIDTEGRLKRAEFTYPGLPKVGRSEWEEAILLCGSRVKQLVQALHWLYRAFDGTWLSDAMEEEPQEQFFPGAPLAVQVDDAQPEWWVLLEANAREGEARDADRRAGQTSLHDAIEDLRNDPAPLSAFQLACEQDKGRATAIKLRKMLEAAIGQGPLSLTNCVDHIEDQHGIPGDLYGQAEAMYALTGSEE